jgi:formylglycine-generating enzyme required for sulfatase activity
MGTELTLEQTRPGPPMVRIPGGTFLMGSDAHYPEEAPAHRVTVSGFWMDSTNVTNAQFAAFVRATGYVTLAERSPDPAQFPGADPAMLVPGALVFRKSRRPVDLRDFRNWWSYLPGASWEHPDGPASSIASQDDFPVVQIAFEDAQAYAQWAQKELPTEAEWEFAARGGLEGAEFAWGEELAPAGRHQANTWQGEFPWQNLREDGFEGRAPVQSFAPNSYGLFEMTGNVWEWTSDWYRDRHKKPSPDKPCCAPLNPRGPSIEHSYDPCMRNIRIPRKVIKGGSFLCAPNYCRRYRPAARHAQMVDTATCHIGFRCVVR